MLGPNGAGKTTLLRVAALYQHPSRGTVDVLGDRLGRCDVRTLRERIAFSSPALAAALEPRMTAAEVVMTAKYAALAPWWHTYTDADRDRALELLAHFHAEQLADHRFPTLSAGRAPTCAAGPDVDERARHRAARRADRRPRRRRSRRARARPGDVGPDPTRPPLVLVTHHLEEVPPGFTHALVMKDAGVLAYGPLAETLTSDSPERRVRLALTVEHADGRYSARLG